MNPKPYGLDGDPHRRLSPYSTAGAARQAPGYQEPPGVLPVAPEKVYVSDPQAFGEMSLFPFTVGTSSIRILVSSATARTFLSIQNQSANAVYVNFGSNAAVGTGFLLSPGVPASNIAGGDIWFDTWLPQGDVYAIASGAGSVVMVGYCNKAF